MNAVERAPSGFRAHKSGLLVPEEHSRARQAWTKDEGRLLERATKLLASRGVRVYFGCVAKGCQSSPMMRTRLANGDFTLQCACTDRVFQQAF